MIIRKFLHSCISLEHDGSSLLIDPGEFSFIEGKLTPSELPRPDAILLTHEHSDHYFPPAIKAILEKKKSRIITHGNIAKLLQTENLVGEILNEGISTSVESFSILGVRAPHGELPTTPPMNLGFFVNDTIFHPGDSLSFVLPQTPKVLLLPIAAPWLTIVNALEAALRIKPEIVVPIHDCMIKDFMLTRMYGMLEKSLKANGIAFRPLSIGETLEI